MYHDTRYIGSVEVLDYHDTKNKSVRLRCKCERCGREYIAYKKHLKNGHNKLCQLCSAGKDPIEMRHGTWIVTRIVKNDNGNTMYHCVCRSCEAEKVVNKEDFKNMPECSCQGTDQYKNIEDFFNAFSF